MSLTLLFILANLSVGYTFSTIASNQLQAMQMSFFFFLPNMLLSGFMFPFRGMPEWAQAIGEILPLTHFLRIVRAIMLKGATFGDLQSTCSPWRPSPSPPWASQWHASARLSIEAAGSRGKASPQVPVRQFNLTK